MLQGYSGPGGCNVLYLPKHFSEVQCNGYISVTALNFYILAVKICTNYHLQYVYLKQPVICQSSSMLYYYYYFT